MPTYTLIITNVAAGRQHTTWAEFPNDVTAIKDAAAVLTAELPSIAIARGVGDEIEFLGAWDLVEGSTRWTADE
jgi:hypothetical protein